MKIAIHQPNYLPWIGYFHKILNVDQFVFFDDIQLSTGKSFTTRVQILINEKANWLTVPVIGKSDNGLIKDVKVNNSINWQRKHIKTLELNYKKTPFFDSVFPILENILRTKSEFLIDYNIPLIQELSNYIGLQAKFVSSSTMKSDVIGTENRILELNKKLYSKAYYTGTGKGSKRYLNEDHFKDAGIELIWQEFEPFSYYQSSDSFTPFLSIVDLLFREGINTKNLLKQYS